MPLPNFSRKHTEEALFAPEEYAIRGGKQTELANNNPPDAVLVCYHDLLRERLKEKYDTRTIQLHRGEIVYFDDIDANVGLVGGFGVGAPATAIVVEELIAAGVRQFLAIGFAGCLQETVDSGAILVCDAAIRDEGVSHHYLPPERVVTPSEAIVATAENTLELIDVPFHTGTTWTLDAFYRETAAEVEAYAEDGVLSAEMEAAGIFAIAERRDVDAGAMFVPSDYLTPIGWQPERGATMKGLVNLAAVGRRVLQQSL